MYKEQEFKNDSVFSLLPSKGNGVAIFGSLYFISGLSEGGVGTWTGGGREGNQQGEKNDFSSEVTGERG